MIDNTQKEMLLETVENVIDALSDDLATTDAKQMAFGYYNKSTSEIFEVQVIVTRDENEFMNPLNMDVTSRETDF